MGHAFSLPVLSGGYNQSILAEAAAHRFQVSRSQLYATVLAEFLERRQASTVTESLNKIYSRRTAKVDPVLHRAQLNSIARESPAPAEVPEAGRALLL